MARKSNKTTSEKITSVEELIATKEKELSDLKETLSQLINQKREEDKEQVYRMLESNNISYDKLKILLKVNDKINNNSNRSNAINKPQLTITNDKKVMQVLN